MLIGRDNAHYPKALSRAERSRGPVAQKPPPSSLAVRRTEHRCRGAGGRLTSLQVLTLLFRRAKEIAMLEVLLHLTFGNPLIAPGSVLIVVADADLHLSSQHLADAEARDP